MNGLVFHPCQEDGRSEGVAFDCTYQLSSGGCDRDGEIESPDPCEQGEDSDRSCFGRSHTTNPPTALRPPS
jgi:hypothetical protein